MAGNRIARQICFRLLLAVIPVLIAAGLLLTKFTVSQLQGSYLSSVSASASLIVQIFSKEKVKTENYLRFISSEGSFLMAMEQGISYGDKDALQNTMKGILASIDVDALEAFDKGGKSVVRVDNKAKSQPAQSSVKPPDALQAGLEISSSGALIAGSAPVKQDANALGFIRVETRVDAAFLSKLGDSCGACLMLLSEGIPVASSNVKQGQEALPDAALAQEAVKEKSIKSAMAKSAGGKALFAGYSPLEAKSADGKAASLLVLIDAEGYQATLRKSYWGLGLTLALICVVIALTTAWVSASISKPLKLISESLASASDQMAAASGSIANSSNEIAAGASKQAASLEETSSSLEEMTSVTRQNAESSAQASNTAKDALAEAERASKAMSGMSEAIGKIKSASAQTAGIVKTIDEIAFQTNLLALNAAVEAARAGESGKGFAVVAEEVRSLAQRSTQAAKRTSELIGESQKAADLGVGAAKEVGDVLAKISDGVKKISLIVDGVFKANSEQAKGIEHINLAVAELDKLTQDNAASAEESASAGEQLSSQAEMLMSVVQELVALIESGREARGGSEPPQQLPSA